MIFFFLLLILLLISGLIFKLYSIDSKFKTQKRKLNLINNQYTTLRKAVNSDKELFKNLNIQYSKSPYSYGITKDNIKVYYLPIRKFKIIIEINSALEVYILEQCTNNNETWYYVDLKMQNNINSRGWILKDDFSILRDNANPIKSNLLN